MEPMRERIFHVEQVLNYKSRENKFDVDRFTKSIDKFCAPYAVLYPRISRCKGSYGSCESCLVTFLKIV